MKDEFGITFEDRLLLAELGLIASENDLTLGYTQTNNEVHITLIAYGYEGILLKRKGYTSSRNIKVLALTQVGTELSKLIESTPNKNYIERVCTAFNHPNVEIQYGDLVRTEDGQMQLLNPVFYGK